MKTKEKLQPALAPELELPEKPKKLSTKKIMVDIDLIIANPWNPNKMNDFIFQKMKQTIEKEGLFGSIYVRPLAGMYEILDGEHRVKACKELGYTELPVECSEEMTEKEVKFWTIYFNNTRGKDDIEKRSKLLNEIDAGQAQLLPMTDEEFENEKALFHFDFSQFDKQEEIKEKKDEAIVQIIVPRDVLTLWKKTIEVGKKFEKTDVQIFVSGIENFLNLHVGSAPDQRDINL